MNVDEIKKAMQEGPEAVLKIIESEADRRVNTAVETAREKWAAELPGKVDAEIQQRTEAAAEKEAERVSLGEDIAARFADTSIDKEVWDTLIDVDGLLKLKGDERTAELDNQVQRAKDVYDRIKKQSYSGPAPRSGSQETDESRFAAQLTEKMNMR